MVPIMLSLTPSMIASRLIEVKSVESIASNMGSRSLSELKFQLVC